MGTTGGKGSKGRGKAGTNHWYLPRGLLPTEDSQHPDGLVDLEGLDDLIAHYEHMQTVYEAARKRAESTESQGSVLNQVFKAISQAAAVRKAFVCPRVLAFRRRPPLCMESPRVLVADLEALTTFKGLGA